MLQPSRRSQLIRPVRRTYTMGTMLDHKAVPWIFYTASLLVYHVGAALYSVNELQPSSRFELVGRLTFIVAVWYWFLLYSRVRRIAWPLDIELAPVWWTCWLRNSVRFQESVFVFDGTDVPEG